MIENNKDKTNNHVILKGVIKSELKFDHTAYGIDFYSFKIGTKRQSGFEDILNVVVSEKVLKDKVYGIGDIVKITGELRSHNTNNKVIIYVFANSIEEIKFISYENKVHLHGFLCKKPIYRKTPKGRIITDLLIAVNRKNSNKSDYINSIAWGKNAKISKDFAIGDEVIIEGRFQSRDYIKKLKEDKKEKRTAYELSISNIKKIGTNLK